MKSIQKIFIALSVFTLIGLSCRTLLPTINSSDCNSGFCLDGISITFTGQPLNNYMVQLQFPDMEPLIFSCPRATTIFEDSGYTYPINCSPEGIFIMTTEPTNLSIIVNWESGSVSENYVLNYKTSEQNRPGCEPNCKSAKIELNLTEMGTPVVALFPTPTPTSLPMVEKTEDGHWELAGVETSGDWITYQTPSITSVAIEDDYLWVGAYGGLLRWDRKTGSVLHYLAPQTPLPDNDVSDLILYDGNLYIATETAIAIFDRHTKWTIYKNSEIGLGEDYGNEIALYNGEIWVANKTGVAHRSLNGQWSVIKSGTDTFSLEIISKIIAKQDGIYVIGAEKLYDLDHVTYRYSNGKWEKLSANLSDDIVSPNGTYWKSEYEQIYFSKDEGKTWEFAFQWDEYITPLNVDEQNRLYLGSDSTLLVYENNQFSEVYRFTDVGPELNYINIIQTDELGRVWFATDGRGLTMFNEETWRNWQPTNSAMRHDAIRGMAVTKDMVYAGGSSAAGEGGVMIYDINKNEWVNYWPDESELSGGGVEGIAVDKLGRAFFATSEGVLDIFDNGNWMHIPMPPIPNNQILMTSDGIFDSDENYWLGTENFGLWRYNGKDWAVFDSRSKLLPSNQINALSIDKNGRIWVMTGQGLSVRCTDQKWESFSIPGMTEEIIFGDIAIDPGNRIWVVANFDVLSVFNGDEWFSFEPEVVGETTWDDAIAFDQKGNAWVSLSEGVGVFTGALSISPSNSNDICGNP